MAVYKFSDGREKKIPIIKFEFIENHEDEAVIVHVDGKDEFVITGAEFDRVWQVLHWINYFEAIGESNV